MADTNTADLGKGKRITGGDRSSLADELRKRYDGGESIRSLATSTNRSYGFVHRLLSESGAVTAQPRWGQPEQQEGVTSGDLETDGWVRTSRDGDVLTVTLDRADQLNAQTPATWAALAAVGESLDDDVRVVVVRGAGRSFSAGLDRGPVRAPSPASSGTLGDLRPAVRGGGTGADPRLPGGFRWLRSPRDRLGRGGAGPRHRRWCAARARLRPAGHRRRRTAPAARGDARPRARPDRHQQPGGARRLLAGAGDLPDRSRSRRGRGAGDRAGERRRPGRRARRHRRRPRRRAAAPRGGRQPGDGGAGPVRRPQRRRRARTPPSGPPRCAVCTHSSEVAETLPPEQPGADPRVGRSTGRRRCGRELIP